MPNAMRSFDPRRVGRLECAAWVTYYRREWFAFLRAAVGLTRHTFALPWAGTLHGAWLVLRANQLWAPYPDNDPDGARRCMERFYRLVAARHGETFDVAQAARLEVEWWRVHRDVQRRAIGDEAALADALAALYAHVYAVPAGRGAPGRRAARAAPCATPIAGCRRAATSRARWWPRSARRWCAPTRRSWPPCTARG